MPEFGKRVDRPGGRRRVRRLKVVLAGAALSDKISQPVVIEDVCATGAKLRGRNLPETGRTLCISVGEMSLDAAVAWLGAEQCGITFETALDEAGVAQLRQEGRWGQVISII